MKRGRSPWLAGLLAGAALLVSACSLLLPWDGYEDTGSDDAGREATGSSSSSGGGGGDGGDGGGDATADGARAPEPLASLETKCGASLVCQGSRPCCAYGDSRPWTCADASAQCAIDDAGVVLRCDSPNDCPTDYRCCGDFEDGGRLYATRCRQSCPLALRVCDPALGERACIASVFASCRHTVPESGLAVAFCQPD